LRFKPDLDDQLISFGVLTVGLVIWPVKIVLSGTLDTNQPLIIMNHRVVGCGFMCNKLKYEINVLFYFIATISLLQLRFHVQ